MTTENTTATTRPANLKLPMRLGAPEAHAMAAEKTLLLVDIRTPGEWQKTGMPEGAVGLTVKGPEFVDQLLDLMGGDKGHPVALICATGNRSAQVQSYLLANGFSQISDVNEGMMGNSMSGPGWILRGLPTETYAG